MKFDSVVDLFTFCSILFEVLSISPKAFSIKQINLRKICKLIDPEGILKLADSRILSRSEDDNPVKTLSKVIPHGFQQIIILDDRKDVWPGLSNLVFTVPFRYFIKND